MADKSSQRRNVMSGNTNIDFVYGLPPASHMTEEIIANTMPIAEITPTEPKFSEGMNLFSLENKWELYDDLLDAHNFSRKERPIKVAFQADNFPTDSFSNDYGETFLDQFVQAASTGVGDLSQMFGAKSGTELMAGAGTAMGDNMVGNMMTGGAQKIKDLQKQMNAQAKQDSGNAVANRVASSLSATADALVGGGRVDFPLVWKNSSFAPSYSMTVRLYNPYPKDLDATNKYIIGPLAALLILGLPRTVKDSSTYSWPFFTKVKAPGIYNLQASYINSISVIKGGDTQSIAYNQRLSIVDVRMDFGSLYGSILIDESGSTINDRPTLGTYLESMRGERTLPDQLLSKDPSSTTGIDIETSETTNLSTAPTGATAPGDYTEEPISRSDATKLAMAIDLANQGDTGFYA